jgi:putative NADH-flavin reductase
VDPQWNDRGGTVRLTILGATGRIGGRIVSEALTRGHEVTAAVRDGSRFDRAGRPLAVASADVFDPASVTAAVAGCAVVVSAVGHAATLDDRGYYVRAARSLVDALRPLGTGGPRLIVVGGFGSLERTPGAQFADIEGIPEHAAPEIVGQRDALTHLRTVSDVRWTYVSPPPGGIGPGERTGTYRISRDSIDGDPQETYISMEDFAIAVVDEAERGEHLFACLAAARA